MWWKYVVSKNTFVFENFNMEEIPGSASDVSFQVVWEEDGKHKMLSPDATAFDISKSVPLSAHHLDINQSASVFKSAKSLPVALATHLDINQASVFQSSKNLSVPMGTHIALSQSPFKPSDTVSVSMATHHIDISQPVSVLDSKTEPLDATDELIEATHDFSSQMEGEIITEISSSDCLLRKKRGRKKIKKGDHLYGSDDATIESSPKNHKIKKERVSDAPCIVRKRFSRNWYQIPEFSNWLEESPIPGYAFCNVCRKDLLPGKSELMKHAATAKHKRKIEALGHGTKDDPLDHRVVDLRSDTVTVPNRDMREAMKNAEVGDAAFDEDPTVLELEKTVAKLLNMEAGLFVPSGTMANLVCVLAHCWNRGSLVILGDQSHLYRVSQGSVSEIGNVSQRVVRNLPDGTFDLEELKTHFLTHTTHWPSMTLVCIENTHTMMGGKALPLQWMEKLGSLCGDYGVPIHLDGARLINASAALGASPARLVRFCASATFGLDKGLGAPGGCVITGNSDFIDRANLVRKSLGGVIHQAGVLAAACLYGLNNFVSRIAKDHNNARAIAKAVCATNSSAVTVDVNSVQTNIVHLVCDNIRVNPEQLCARLAKVLDNEAVEVSEGVVIKCTAIPPNVVRLMTHGDLMMEEIRAVVRKLQYVIAEYDNYFVIEYNVSENC